MLSEDTFVSHVLIYCNGWITDSIMTLARIK